MPRLMWLGYSSCRHLSARPAKRAAAAGSIGAAPAAGPAAGAAMPIAQGNPSRRPAKNAAGCMKSSFEYLQIAAQRDLSAAARGVWPARYEDRPANSVWGIGL